MIWASAHLRYLRSRFGLVARESPGVALVPPVVVKDELERRVLVEHARVTGLRESFFAVTGNRRFGNPLLKHLLFESVK